MDEVRVTVVNFSDRKFLQMQYRDPNTGRKKTRSTGATNRRAAERVAAKWEAELQEGRYKAPSKTTWEEFRRRYEDESLKALADATADKAGTVLDLVEKYCSPKLLRELTNEKVSLFQARLRDGDRSETTIKGYLAHLSAALNWAGRVGLMVSAPSVESPRRAKSSKVMKGRPIATEEFERMLNKAQGVVGIRHADEWKFYMKGLWFSGLRLAESLELYWERDDRLCVDLSGHRPMLRIPAELEKGNQDRILPMAPEFAEFLARVRNEDRTGRVFKLRSKRRGQARLSHKRVGRIMSAIGKAANVKVHTAPKSGKVKFASAHDLRRSFGERWARRVMPQVLKELMRHVDISTTLKYYVGQNAQAAAQILWAAHEEATSGNTSGNSAQKTTRSKPATNRRKSFN